MSKKKKERKPGYSPEHLAECEKLLKEMNIPEGNKEAAQKAGQELNRQKKPSAAVRQAVQNVTGFSFNFKQLTPLKEGEAPASVQRVVKKKVEEVIAAEAMNRLDQALATGKSLEDSLGTIAAEHGYENTEVFVVDIFGFWDTWHAHVEKVVAERDLYKWAINELIEKLDPDAKQILINQAVKDLAMSTSVLGYLTGNFPPPETMRGYIKVLKEEMM